MKITGICIQLKRSSIDTTFTLKGEDGHPQTAIRTAEQTTVLSPQFHVLLDRPSPIMRNTAPKLAKSIPTRFFVKYYPRPLQAYHLRLPSPVQWTYARDVQNTIIKAYQEHHHRLPQRPLPPTFITLQFKPVFTYGREREERPSPRERMMLEGLPGSDGLNTEIRKAWHRERGWRYHGPGQVHFWMVADLVGWNVSSTVFPFLSRNY